MKKTFIRNPLQTLLVQYPRAVSVQPWKFRRLGLDFYDLYRPHAMFQGQIGGRRWEDSPTQGSLHDHKKKLQYDS